MEKVIFLAFCIGCQSLAHAQETIDIRPIIHEAITYQRQDFFQDCRDHFAILGNLPYDNQSDTIYTIEEYSFENGSIEAMYWSKNFLYTINGTFDQEFRAYPKRHFEKWLVSLIEQWNTMAIFNTQEYMGGPDENYTLMRIVIDSGTICTDIFECQKQLSAPNTDWGDVNELLKIWATHEDYLFLYDCSSPH